MTSGCNPASSTHRPRIGVIRSNIPVTVNQTIRGILADVGPDGIGIVTESALGVGARTCIGFEILGHHLQGDFEVQFMRLMPNGHIRSRLRLMESDSSIRWQLEQFSLLLERHPQDTQPRAA